MIRAEELLRELREMRDLNTIPESITEINNMISTLENIIIDIEDKSLNFIDNFER